ncbi:MAG TPA: lasso peptide biosynthesis B2 protein [Longimicrobiales bacterium]
MMTARFGRRSHSEQHLLLLTALLFGAAHGLLHTVPLPRARSILAHLVRGRTSAWTPAQIAWAAAAVNRNLPGRHSCLVNALCCEAIATGSGVAAELKLGAARGEARMRFHAWVEHRGQTICGGEHGEFVALG